MLKTGGGYMKNKTLFCINVLELSTSRGYAVDVKCCKMFYFTCKHISSTCVQRDFSFSFLTSAKHLQKYFRAVTSRGYTVNVKCFILHVTTSYLQDVFNMLKHSQNVLVFYFRPTCNQRKTFLKTFTEMFSR